MDDFNTTYGADSESRVDSARSGPDSYPQVARNATERDWDRLVGIGDVHAGADNTTSAQEYYERALSMILDTGATDQDRIPIELRIAECVRKRGRYRESLELLTQIFERVGHHGERNLRARILARMGVVETCLAEYPTARVHCEEAYEILRDTDANEEIGYLELTLSVIAHRQGQTAKAREQYESALFTFRRINHSEGIARTLNNLGVLLKNGPRWAEAKDYFTRALAVSEEAGNFARVASHCLNLGILFYKTGEWSLASSQLTRALLIYKETGTESSEIKAHLALGNLKYRRRQHALAETHYQRSLTIARENGYPREEALALEFLGELSLERDDLDVAETYLEDALGVAVGFAPEGDVVGEIKSRQARLWLRRGRTDLAIQLAKDALGVARRIGDGIETGACLSTLGEALAASGQMEAAAKHLEESVSVLEETPDILIRARVRWARIRFLVMRARTGTDVAGGRRLLDEAANRFEEISSTYLDLELPEMAIKVLIELAETHAAFDQLDEALSAVARGFELAETHSVPHVRRSLDALRADLEEKCAESTLTRSAEFQLLREVAGFNLATAQNGSVEAYLHLACERSKSDRALLAIAPDGREELGIDCSEGFDAGSVGEAREVLSGLLDEFRNGRKIYVVGSPKSDPRYDRFPKLAAEIGSAVALPIILSGRPVGLLYLDRSPSNLVGSFRNPDLRLLSFFSGILSVFLSAREGERRARGERDSSPDPEGVYGRFVTCNSEMKRSLSLLRKLDASDDGVLVTGETGTGKGLLARLIHESSTRSSGPLVQVNCAALPETLLESELFGHLRGSFTGADREKLGLFEEAAGGTLFLDEVDKAPRSVQGKLLHVLDKHEIRPVGATRWKPVDVRVICATNIDLREAIEDGRFLEDLYYRLNDFQVNIPPLRERREDIPLLIRHFYEQFASDLGRTGLDISREVMQALTDHEWRGNVRELAKVIKRMLVLAEDGENIGPDLLPSDVQRGSLPRNGRSRNVGTLKSEVQKLEAQLIGDALREAGGNKSEVARQLRISYPCLLSKIKQYSLEPKKDRRRG